MKVKKRVSSVQQAKSTMNQYFKHPVQVLGEGSSGLVFLVEAHSIEAPLTRAGQAFHFIPPLVAVKAFSKSEEEEAELSRRSSCCSLVMKRCRNEEQILCKLRQQQQQQQQQQHHHHDHHHHHHHHHHQQEVAPDTRRNPFLPTFYCGFEDAHFRYLVLDYCAGGDLNSLRHSLPDRRFSCSAIRFYAAEIVLALEHLHGSGVVYRDLKPENILLSSDGHIVLTDFDLSAILSKDAPGPKEVKSSCGSWGSSSRHYKRIMKPSGDGELDDEDYWENELERTEIIGTDEYLAPEMILWGHQKSGYEVDWWAFGILLYEMVYGKTPFRGASSSETFANILHREVELRGLSDDPALRDLIVKLLVKKPEARLGSGGGAIEVKSHAFFHGLQWDSLPYQVLRPPFLPST